VNLARSSVRLVCTLPALVAVVLSIRSADAQAFGSVALRWNNCYGDGGTAARNFACTSNSGSDELVISIFPPYEFINATEVDIDLQVTSTGANTPNWWTFATGGCRGTGGMQLSLIRPATSTNCLDPWLGQAFGGYLFEPVYLGPNSGRLRIACGLEGGVTMPANSEVFVASMVILHQKTIGAGACAGCPTGACIGILRVKVWNQTSSPDTDLLLPLPNTTSDVVGWQMDASMPENVLYEGPAGFESWQKHFTGCSAAVTGTRRSTWGTVKSLYR